VCHWLMPVDVRCCQFQVVVIHVSLPSGCAASNLNCCLCICPPVAKVLHNVIAALPMSKNGLQIVRECIISCFPWTIRSCEN
jgi:hypothetical protein